VKLYCATTNSGKLAEFRLAAGGLELETLPGLRDIPACEETGATFEDNAVQKAHYYSLRAPRPLFVDDSGLEVRALGGAPGVLSARFAGDGATDQANNQLLLERLNGVQDRSARFVCVVALAHAGKLIRTFRGTVEGRIAEAPRGSNGFGYDPLFFYPPFNRTFGEVSAAQKLQVSHRSKALRAMVEYLLASPPAPVE
jgi:XTP/dITP diphosphohydrolase